MVGSLVFGRSESVSGDVIGRAGAKTASPATAVNLYESSMDANPPICNLCQQQFTNNAIFRKHQ